MSGEKPKTIKQASCELRKAALDFFIALLGEHEMRFTFPAYKDIPTTPVEIMAQLKHTRRECNEAINALADYGKDSPEFIDEVLDITHCNETLLRLFTDEQLEKSIARVTAKNFFRGYYRSDDGEDG